MVLYLVLLVQVWYRREDYPRCAHNAEGKGAQYWYQYHTPTVLVPINKVLVPDTVGAECLEKKIIPSLPEYCVYFTELYSINVTPNVPQCTCIAKNL